MAMRVISLCEAIIVVDAFTWWSAYLGTQGEETQTQNKSVMMVDEWLEDGSEGFEAAHLALPSWMLAHYDLPQQRLN